MINLQVISKTKGAPVQYIPLCGAKSWTHYLLTLWPTCQSILPSPSDPCNMAIDQLFTSSISHNQDLQLEGSSPYQARKQNSHHTLLRSYLSFRWRGIKPTGPVKVYSLRKFLLREMTKSTSVPCLTVDIRREFWQVSMGLWSAGRDHLFWLDGQSYLGSVWQDSSQSPCVRTKYHTSILTRQKQ